MVLFRVLSKTRFMPFELSTLKIGRSFYLRSGLEAGLTLCVEKFEEGSALIAILKHYQPKFLLL